MPTAYVIVGAVAPFVLAAILALTWALDERRQRARVSRRLRRARYATRVLSRDLAHERRATPSTFRLPRRDLSLS